MGLRKAGFAALCCLCGACEIATSRAESEPREVAPVVLFVRQPVAQVATAALAPLLPAPPPAAPADGSQARPFSSLRAALRLAPSGALLRVEEGIWRESLEIIRPVVLMGRGVGRTRIVPPDGSRVAVEVRSADHVQLYGLSIEGAREGLRIAGGVGHRLENVELKGMTETALAAQGAEIAAGSVWVTDIAGGTTGHGIEVVGGSFDARNLVLRKAGRRALVLQGARGVLQDLEVSGSAMAAVQALDKADVRVLRGEFDGQGGAAIYAGAARLFVEGSHIRHDEYAIIAARGSELTALGNELTDYRVAGVALVSSHGTVQRTLIARGGTEGGISINFADGKVPVLLVDNRIHDPGTMGVHVTGAAVTARGNTITGARLDREKDMGDGFYAVESNLVLEDNVMRSNAGSGVATVRTTLQLDRNGLLNNGRAGVLLLDSSKGTATGNLFQRNATSGVEVGERAHATLAKNHFDGNQRFDIDTGCGKGLAGSADLRSGNTFVLPVRRRACVE